MQDNRTKLAFVAVLLMALLLVVTFSARGTGPNKAMPAANIGEVQTAAVETFAAGLTGTTMALPTASATSTTAPTSGVSSIGTGSVTPKCLSLHFIRDVTIPDNTDVIPAQVFTKTWLVQNSGTCPWQPGFQVVLVGGAAMGGSPFKVAQSVGPGGTIQISIKMAAPTNQTGVVQGSWMMADANGSTFRDLLYVLVVVHGTTRTPSSSQVSPTP